jgi:hypothetical protein
MGKTLSPPLATLPKLRPSSWIDDWLPELLWVVLLLSGMQRENALAQIRLAAKDLSSIGDDSKPKDATHSSIAGASEATRNSLLDNISNSVQARDALRPLLLLNGLPAQSDWESTIGMDPEPDDWSRLASAIALALFHQSEAATDARWDPDYGDMRKVRPFIRATEIAMRGLFEEEIPTQDPWPAIFWDQCFVETECYPLGVVTVEDEPQVETTLATVEQVYDRLIAHASEVASTTGTDPAHDTTFGVAFFALSILKELLESGKGHQITSRLGLRTLLEALISLAYLLRRNDPELWHTYRIYGSGQTKLALLKTDELRDPPHFVDIETLRELANEDIWQEFLSIDLGHWEKSNLLQLSLDSGTKDEYDKYYPWLSAYAHSHWGAIRDTDRILELLAKSYPPFPHRVSI